MAKTLSFLGIWVGIPILGGLLLAEVFLRYQSPSCRVQGIDASQGLTVQGEQCVGYAGWACFSPATGWWGRPNLKEFHYASSCFRHPVTINNFGVHDFRNYSKEKKKNVRIAMLGDSFTHALQVGDQEHLSALVERMFHQKVEVLNFGQSGYSTAQAYLSYLHRVREFKPDIVVLNFLPLNDILENHPVTASCYEGKDIRGIRPFRKSDVPQYSHVQDVEGSVFSSPRILAFGNRLTDFDPSVHQSIPSEWVSGSTQKLPLWRKLHRNLMAKSQTYCTFARSKHGVEFLQNRAKANSNSHWDLSNCGRISAFSDKDKAKLGVAMVTGAYAIKKEEQWKEAWNATATYLNSLRNAVEKDGAKFVLNILADPIAVADSAAEGLQVLGVSKPKDFDPFLPTNKVARIAKQDSVTHLNLAEGFLRYKKTHNLKFPHFSFHCDGHYSPVGHYVAAKLLSTFLLNHTKQLRENAGALVAPDISPLQILGSESFAEIYGRQNYLGKSTLNVSDSPFPKLRPSNTQHTE